MKVSNILMEATSSIIGGTLYGSAPFQPSLLCIEVNSQTLCLSETTLCLSETTLYPFCMCKCYLTFGLCTSIVSFLLHTLGAAPGYMNYNQNSPRESFLSMCCFVCHFALSYP